MPRDPVCGMEVDERDAAAVVQQGSKTYYFCSDACKEQFEAVKTTMTTITGSRGSSPASDVVRRGGVAKEDAEVEDITRDTYGVPSPAPMAGSREERIANADRAAGQAGIPGVDVSESPSEPRSADGYKKD